jgi:hypothetical protein
VRWEFPARGDMPPLTLRWFDGSHVGPRPKDLEPGRRMQGDIYLGEKGTLMDHRLIPESKMKAYGRPPQVLPRSVGHDKEWIDACKGGPPAGSDFVAHSGLLTEIPLLGVLAIRLAGKKLLWDGPNLRFTNDEAANRLLQRTYREGWTL